MLNRVAKRLFATVAPSQAPLVIRNNSINASVILSRAPQITRDSTPFERAYFDYREKLERQHAQSFPTEFYFKKGSLAERRWKEEEAARQAAMSTESSLTAAATDVKHELEDVGLNKIAKTSRITKADEEKNIKSLDRALQRTLYLVVHKPDASPAWQFPQGQIDSSEYLHEAAERQLKEDCGSDMDVWFVGRQPVSHFKEAASRDSGETGSKTFFMKARVYAGQVKPGKGVSDYAWLTREELADYLAPEYYNAIKESLSDL
ncbi:39S mitochondrial ribosomal protein L46-domain-containing protein [Dichotomocladium elegans]|nr:39S mitochondrial ribosomal protein L46-domain-containing protein [Dichotomocladium elegans]